MGREVDSTQEENVLQSQLEPLIHNMGFCIVEFKAKQNRKNFHVSLVIHHPDGIGVDQCGEVYKTLYPRLEIIEEGKEIHLEVSSPGINRVFKSNTEFHIFKGKQAAVYLREENMWVSGIITEADDDGVTLDSGTGGKTYPYNNIQKAKLEEVK